MRSAAYSLLLAPLSLAAPLAIAQESLPSPPTVVTQDLCALQSVDGELWAGGALYKARFDAAGMTFVPALGKEVERSLPLNLQLVEVTRGAGTLGLVTTEAADPNKSGDRRVERARGELVEIYDVRTEGVELSYALGSLPTGHGDLVLRLAVDTELVPPTVGTYSDGVHFGVGDGNAVTVGAVVAIDAVGRSVTGELAFDGSDLSLVVPAQFVDAAVLPLLVDPLVSITQVTDGFGDHRAPDVAFDTTTGNYLAVWQRFYSGSDSDIWAQRLDSNGALLGSPLFLETSIPDSAVLPCVGNVASSDRFLVIWQEFHPTLGWNIISRAVKASDGSVSNRVTLASTSNDEEWPDVNTSANADDLIVVWEEENVGIKGRSVQVTPSGDPIPGSTFTYSADPDAHRPAISKSSDSIGTQLLVWQKYYPTPAPGDHDLFAMALAALGHSVSETILIAGDIGPDESDPSVDGDGQSWLIAYQKADDLFSLDGEIRAASVLRATYGYALDKTGIFVDNVAGVNDGAPAVANTGDTYLVAYTSQSYLDSDLTIRLRTLDPFCADCNDFAAIESSTFTTVGTPLGIVSQRSGSFSAVPSGKALAVYSAFPTGLGLGQVQAVNWESENGLYTFVTTACSQSYAFAPCARAGNTNFTHRLVASDPGVESWVMIGQSSGAIVCAPYIAGGSCYLAVDPYTAFIASAGTTDIHGRAAVTTPLPDSSALVGLMFYEQWATLPTFGSGSCSNIGVNLSDGLRITIQ